VKNVFVLSRQYFGGDPRMQAVFETLEGAKAWAAEEDAGEDLSWHLSFGRTSARGGNDHAWDIEEMELLP
jgi:hypothetical protein